MLTKGRNEKPVERINQTMKNHGNQGNNEKQTSPTQIKLKFR